MDNTQSSPPTLNIAKTFFSTASILCLLSLPFLLFLILKFTQDFDLQPYITQTPPQSTASRAESPAGDSPTGGSKRTQQPKPWVQDPNSRPFVMVTRLAIFSAAAFFGALGAIISALTRGIGMADGPSIVTSAQLIGLELIGAVFACVLALVFAGGLIQGSLFPQSHFGSWFTVIYEHAEFAKLLVWSFLVGFSERLMPQLLEVFADRFSGTVAGTRHEESQQTRD